MIKPLLSLLFLLPSILTYMQFQLQRNPHKSKKLALLKSECQDPSKLSEQTKYLELCYEKDIAYVFEFKHSSRVYYLALDLTSPVSWIKDPKCKLLGTNNACTFLQQNFNERVKGMVRQKVNDLMSKLKSKIADDDSKAIIEGSNEIIMGDVTQIKDLSIVAKNHDHLSKAIDVVLLGLYIIGERDNITLKASNFISAHSITPNVNNVCDGAVSLRFDDNSEKSFLCELFDLTEKKENIISVYLGKDKNVVTIGALSQRFAEKGLSSIVKVKLENDDKYGKLPRMQGLVFQNQDQLNNIQADSLIIFTLSSSYIAFPSQLITLIFSKFFPSTLKCKINPDSYIQCLNFNKEDIQTIMETSMNIDLDTSMIHFQMKDLVLSNQKGKIIFNIKQTVNNYTVIGQPFFLNYYVYFDYGKNELGYAARKLTLEEHIITAITLIHFIMITLLLGFCFLITSDPCKKIYYRLFMRMVDRTQDTIKNTVRRYQPVLENEDKVARAEDVEGI